MTAKTLIWALALYAGVVLLAWLGQRRLTYFPDPERVSPAAAGLAGVQERLLETPDGEKLVVWQAKAQTGQPTLLYFHGNAGGLVSRAERFARYIGRGYGLFAMSYRGYAGSTGSPTETHNRRDALLAYATLVGDGVRPDDILLYGESLGSSVAVSVAAEKPVGGVVLDAPFTSVLAIAAKRYWMLPVRTLLADRYESDRRIGDVRAPLLILHGERDRVVPSDLGRKLFELANEPKQLVLYPEGNHSDLDTHGAVETVTQWWMELNRR
jgi:fermentation-respiration switch protein FrsA (DUF1100 family)